MAVYEAAQEVLASANHSGFASFRCIAGYRRF